MYTVDHLVNFIKLDSCRSRLCVSGVVYSMFPCFFTFELLSNQLSVPCHVSVKKVFYFYGLSYSLYCVNHVLTFLSVTDTYMQK